MMTRPCVRSGSNLRNGINWMHLRNPGSTFVDLVSTVTS